MTFLRKNLFVRENPKHIIGQSLESEHSIDKMLENLVARQV